MLTSGTVADFLTTWETRKDDIEFGTAVTLAKDLLDSFDASTAILTYDSLQLEISTA